MHPPVEFHHPMFNHSEVIVTIHIPKSRDSITGRKRLVGWGLMALSTQFRSYRTFKVKIIL